MSWSLIRPARALVRALSSHDSPRQIALGIAIGMLIGLVPKGNLIAVLLAILLLALRVNRASGLCAAFVFTWIGMLLDPLADTIGLAILSHQSCQGLFTWLYDQPLAAWTSFNNTVVLGSLVLGLGLFYPIYRASMHVVKTYAPSVLVQLQKYRAAQLLFGADWATRWRIS